MPGNEHNQARSRERQLGQLSPMRRGQRGCSFQWLGYMVNGHPHYTKSLTEGIHSSQNPPCGSRYQILQDVVPVISPGIGGMGPRAVSSMYVSFFFRCLLESDYICGCEFSSKDPTEDEDEMTCFRLVVLYVEVRPSVPSLSVCGGTFTTNFLLKGRSHIAAAENLFMCPWPLCGKVFARQNDYQRHEQLHMSHLPFTCEDCDKQFARMDALSRHRSCFLPTLSGSR